MNPIPSPYERLLHLESELERLKASGIHDVIRKQDQSTLPTRQIWPADELLLTRILRRSPEALAAYQGDAELTGIEQRGLRLTAADSSSAFRFCEIVDGDAVVWVEPKSLRWAWRSEHFQFLFDSPPGADTPDNLVVHALPLFRPLARGQAWTLHRKGKMGLQTRLFPEQAQDVMLLGRLEKLERRFSQQKVQFEAEVKDLRSQLQIQQRMIEGLLRIFPPDQPPVS